MRQTVSAVESRIGQLVHPGVSIVPVRNAGQKRQGVGGDAKRALASAPG